MTATYRDSAPPWDRPSVAAPRRRHWTQDQREALLLGVLAIGAAAVIGLWWANNPGRSLHTFADRVTAAGRITGLVGTYLVLVQVLLMSRLPWLDRWIGTDRMAAWHRSNGQYTIALLAAHTALITSATRPPTGAVSPTRRAGCFATIPMFSPRPQRSAC